MKIRSLFLYGTIILIAQCSQQNLIGSTETTNGTITGKLVNSRGQPAVNAKVMLIDTNHIASFPGSMQKRSRALSARDTVVLTDTQGIYSLPLPSIGTYNIFGEMESGLNVLVAHVDVKDTVSFDVGTDTVTPPGQIKGVSFMPGLDSIDQMRVVMAIPGTNYITIPNVGGGFSFTKVPHGAYSLRFVPMLPEYDVRILTVIVESGKVTNLDTVYLYGKAITGLPKVNAGKDTVVSVKDTIRLHGVADDPYGRILAKEWDIGNTGIFRKAGSDDTATIAPSRALDDYKCIFRAIDNDSNVTIDTVHVSVLLDPPIADAGNDTTVRADSFYTVNGSGIDRFGKIVMYRFDTDGDEQFEDSSTASGVKRFRAPPTFGTFIVIVQVEDDDGNTSNSMMLLDVLQRYGD